MIRWVVFDDDTAEVVVSRLRRGGAEINHSAPVDAALEAAGPAILVLPGSTPGRLLVARFSRRTETASPASVPVPASTRPKKPTASAPKPWWRRIA